MYVVSFAFVYNPSLLAKGTALEISLALVTAAPGSVLVAAAIRSFSGQTLHWLSRALTFGGGLLLIGADHPVDNPFGPRLRLLGYLSSTSGHKEGRFL